MPINTNTNSAYALDAGGILIEVPSSETVDNIFIFNDGARKVRRVVDGPYRAAWAGLFGAGDKSIILQAIFVHSSVKVVVVDTSFTINGTVSIPTGKILRLQGDAVISGTGTISGGTWDVSRHHSAFASSLNLVPEKVFGDFFSAKWIGKSTVTFDTVAEANAEIASGARYIGLTVLVTVAGVPKEYWYEVGTSDVNLIAKKKVTLDNVLTEGNTSTLGATVGSLTSTNAIVQTANSAANTFAGTVAISNSTSSPAFTSTSTTGLGLAALLVNNGSTNVVSTIATFRKNTTGTPSSGFGQSIDLEAKTSTGAFHVANQLISSWTTTTTASRVSDFSITGVNNAVTSTLITLKGDGSIVVPAYITSVTGATPAFVLGVDTAGKIITQALAGDMFLNSTNTMGSSGKIAFATSATDSDVISGRLEIQGIANSQSLVGHNTYYNTNLIHRNTGALSFMRLEDSAIYFGMATTQTAGTTASPTYPLAITSSGIIVGIPSGYVNFNSISGTGGHGIRSNAGIMEWKDEGGTWNLFAVGGGGGSMTNPMTTPYDIIIGASGGTPNRLGLGAANTVLISDGSTLAYGSMIDNLVLGEGIDAEEESPGIDKLFLTGVPDVQTNGTFHGFLGDEWGMHYVVTAVGAVGTSSNANGAVVSGHTLYLQPASGSFPGVISTVAQVMGAGLKTFLSGIKLSNLAGNGTGVLGVDNNGDTFWTASGGYTTEEAQDAVGAMVNSTLTYVDATPSLGINLGNANTWTAGQSFNDGTVYTTSGGGASLRFWNDGTGSTIGTFHIQPTTGTNSSPSLHLIPLGTGSTSTIKSTLTWWNTDVESDGTNFEYFRIRAAGTDGIEFNSAAGGTGTVRDMKFKLSGTSKMIVTANGVQLILQTYADDAAAGAGGLTATTLYQTATGELRIKL